MATNPPMAWPSPFTALVGCLFAAVLVAGCQTDLDIERYEYRCDSSAECSRDFECAHLQDRNLTICVPPDQVESCATPGDEDGDGAADCDDHDCADFAGCSVDADAGDTGPGDADTGGEDAEDADTGGGDAEGDADAGPRDGDQDGVIDSEDNCPQHYNPDQRESGEAGVGQACADTLPVDMAEPVFYESSSLTGASPGAADLGGVAVLGELTDDLDYIAIGTPAANNGDGVVSIVSLGRSPSNPFVALTSPTIARIAPDYGGGLGVAVAVIGDIDNGGLPELAVGQPSYVHNANAVGAVHIYWGETLLDDSPTPAATLIGEEAGGEAGNIIVALGDVDDDGTPDFAVGAPGTTGGMNDAQTRGTVYVVSGASLGTLSSLGEVQVSAVGAVDSGFGSAIAAGDFDGDNLTDMASGAPTDSAGDKGLVYLLYGSTLAAPGETDEVQFDLSDGGDADLQISNFDDSSGDFGAALALAGDLDGDDRDDLVIASKWASNSQGDTLAGELHVVHGTNTFAAGASTDITQINGAITIGGVQAEQLLGTSLSYVNDINGDGNDDLIAGAKDSGADSQGAAYLVIGPYDEPSVSVTDVAVAFEGLNDDDNLGLKAAPAGTYAGGEFPGFLLYSPSGDIDDGGAHVATDVPTWYFFSGPFYSE